MLLAACGTHEEATGGVSSGENTTEDTAEASTTAPAAPQQDIPEVTFDIVPTAAPTEPDSTDEQSTEAAPVTTQSADIPEGAKVIAFTFDDGPDMRYTSSTKRILDALEKYGAKATFFVLAQQLDFQEIADEETKETFSERNTKLLKRAYDMGMEIGSHTYNHKDLNKLSTDEIEKELGDACARTESITGGKVKIMRPPYGNANEKVRDAIDMPMIIWDVDSLDWQSKDPDKIYNEVMSHVKPGSVILFHDIYNTTADGVERLLPDLIEQGYTIVTVSELYSYYGKTLEPHKVYMSAWYDN